MSSKFSILVGVVVIVAGASLVQAAPIYGIYDGGNGMLDGHWSESFIAGGPSLPNNELKAGSWDGLSLAGQWELSGVILVNDQIVSNQTWPSGLQVIQYYTTYAGGTATLKNGPWTGAGDGDYVVDLSNITLSTIVTLFQGNLLTVTGAFSMEGVFQGEPAIMDYLASTTKIIGNGAAAPAAYPTLSGAFGGQWGEANDTVMSITIPEPATLGLLGLGGLLMLVRRRRRK